MKRTIYIFLAIFLFTSASAQDITESAKKVKSGVVSSEYDRNSFTYLGIDLAEQFSAQACTQLEKLAVPDKFYDNAVETKTLSAPGQRETFTITAGLVKRLSDDKLIELLHQNKIGQKIIAKWFNRQPDGTFNTNLLKERGMFNANDADYIIASASKRGESALMDMGMGLINKSYVMVVDFDNLMTMEQVYNQSETPADKRHMNGFMATVNAYIYKLNFNDSVAAYFFQDYWTSAPDQNKISAFEAATFPFVPVQHFQQEILATQFNPGHALAPKVQKTSDELFQTMVQSAHQAIINDVEKKNDEFRVKAYVSAVDPIAAKIGKKEGLGFDQRYFVYENRERNNGSIESKRRGVVKAMKVMDNRKVTTGDTDPSLFYQIAGGKIDAYGMFMEQKNDVGANFVLGYTDGGLGGVNGRLEYYIGKLFYKSGNLSKGLTSLKLYVEGGIDAGSFDYNGVSDFTFARVSGGLNKDFYLTNFLHWGPFLGFGVESATWDTSENTISSMFIEGGARVGINIRYNVQLIGSATYYLMLSSEETDPDDNVVTEEVDYSGIFERGNGLGISVGLRIMF
ncbi:MAG: hypothetical protein RBS73_11665 [Prolixibacteraceae bacterium]|jgi:hypothetical protein|nr:hypothetical protein [Prolixibacteraceae bacterium]